MTASAPAVQAKRIRIFIVFLICWAISAPSFASDFEELAGNSRPTKAYGISNDGSVVVGQSYFATMTRWDVASGVNTHVDGEHGVAYAVSDDGGVAVGNRSSRAYYWLTDNTVHYIGPVPGGAIQSSAFAVNGDGSVIVGSHTDLTSTVEAFRWTQATGLVGLGDLAGGAAQSMAYGVSGDGSIVVGRGESGSGVEAFRWTQAGGMVGLGDLSGGDFWSEATAITRDGTTIVGWGTTAAGKEVFRWTQTNGMVGLGTLGWGSEARAVSNDGSVIVGNDGGLGSGRERAFRWTEETGMQSLSSILTSNGVDMTGWVLENATGITGDGATIVGYGTNLSGNIRAYIARTNGVITTTALNNSLSAMGQVGTTAASMSQANISAMMDASHGAILNTTSGLSSGDEMTGRTQLWVVGTLISDSSFSGDDFGGEGGVGLTHYLANGVSVGGGIFTGARSLDTSYGGNQETSLIGPGVFVAYAPEADGLRLEAGGTYHYIDMDLKRGYQNGAGSAQSDGNTIGHAFGLYGRIGWAFPIADRFALQPFAQYNWQRMNIDGYTESGGPFPASFDDRTDTSNRARLGLEAQYAYSEALDFWTWAAWDHRFESKGSSMSGSLTGLYAFNYGGGSVDQNWGDAGVGAKWRPYEGFETFSRLGFGIDSQDNAEPDLALTIGLGWDI